MKFNAQFFKFLYLKAFLKINQKLEKNVKLLEKVTYQLLIIN